MERKYEVCPLCGNEIKGEDKQQCQFCKGKEEYFFGIQLGYIYPAEAKITKDFIKYIFTLILIFVIGLSFWVIGIQQSANLLK